MSEVRPIPLMCNIQTHHFTTFIHKAGGKPFIFLVPRKVFFKKKVSWAGSQSGGEHVDARGAVGTDHHVLGAVPFEDLPVGLVGAVSHTELGGVVGLQVVFGTLGLDPCDQDFPLHVHLHYSKAIKQNRPCQQVTALIHCATSFL